MTNTALTFNNTEQFGQDIGKPQLSVIENEDLSKRALYKLARIIYAETHCETLSEVEALATMIANIVKDTNRTPEDIAEDKTIFECLNTNSARHSDLLIRYDAPALQMCVRTMSRALNGLISAPIRGAIRFHRAELLPDWAIAEGTVAEIHNLHFYR
jgi:hypothetical protein